MEEEIDQPGENISVGRLFLPSLVFSRFATTPTSIILSLLLIEIGLTFDLPVGVTGQIGTAKALTAFISSLLMGVLSIRFKHKSILITGLLLLSVALAGCGLSSNFNMFLLFYILLGFAIAMIFPMTTSLVAKHLPLQKRANAIGLLMATGSVSILIGTPIIRFISDITGWRLVYLIYALPYPIIALILVTRGLPPESDMKQSPSHKRSITDGFKGIFLNTSANACLLSNALSSSAWQGILLYSISFYRQQFMVSKEIAAYTMIGASLTYTIGALISSKLVNQFGRKPVTSIFAFITGVFIFLFTIVPNLWISYALMFMGCIFAGIRGTAIASLTIEQVPEFGGTMMSVNAASANLGSALGSGIGGLALLLYGYRAIGPSLGVFGLVAAIIVHKYAIDPTRAY